MFKVKNLNFELNKKTYIMGILNITPDSFLDGGRYSSPSEAAAHAAKMRDEGADIIDIGAMSTRPGSTAITPEEEISRLKAVLPQLVKKLDIPLSVDTVYPKTARYAIENGAQIINDVSGAFNESMAKIVKDSGAGWIITHAPCAQAGDSFEYKNGITAEINAFFDDVLKQSQNYGIAAQSICLDPGFGFAKNTAQNMELLASLKAIKREGCALLCGLSAKRFIGEVTNQPLPENRLYGTIAANICAVYAGANIIRVHNVKAHADAMKIIDSLKK